VTLELGKTEIVDFDFSSDEGVLGVPGFEVFSVFSAFFIIFFVLNRYN